MTKEPQKGRAGSKAGEGKSARQYLAEASSGSIYSLTELGLTEAQAQAAEARIKQCEMDGDGS